MSEFLTPSSKLPPYLAFPRFLLDMNISETAKLLYVVLLDRARLSLQNDGWTDENGHVFLYYTIANLAVALHRSEMTIKTALNILTDHDLIVRRRQGSGNPNRIYVKVPVVMDSKLSPKGQESRPTDGKKSVRQGARKLSPNNKKVSKNNGVKQVSNTPSLFGSFQNVLLTGPELTALQADYRDWAERIEHLSSYMASTGKTYQSHAATIRLWAAKDKPTATAEKRIYECEESESL